MTLEEFKDQYPFNIERYVEWAEMDAFQHVNNTVYFRYFERVRFEYFETVGLTNAVENRGIAPILASTQCRFKLPLSYPDNIVIGTYITDLQPDRFLMKYAIYSLKHKRVAAEGDGLIVSYDYGKGEKAAIPETIFAILQTD